MTRFASERRVFYFEEPIFDVDTPELRITRDQGVYVCEPHLPRDLSPDATTTELRRLLYEMQVKSKIDRPVMWYYTPMALDFARDITSSAIVFDCMDELSAFHGAPRELLKREAELLKRADLVFTGGQSLYEAKRERHRRAYAFPSSVDVPHFCSARQAKTDPVDQAAIPHPRLGFFGVVDERMDLSLLDAVATARPEWHLVILGPCVKIDPATLPRHSNIHYLGMKKYDELPAYLSGWDVALLPFAKNESTKFISPTKTPEYLAAGRRVVSTSVRDVVRPYGEQELVYIADRPEDFIRAIERALEPPPQGWRQRVDAFLSNLSWDRTWSEMSALIDGVTGPSHTGREQMTGLAVPGSPDVQRPRPASSF
ncbi:MAG TPA: glycosyltransferase [Vicinamibacterales bacterium]|nr:glycosyltransferase [Vicinamibacterales bacterium]